MKNTKLLNYSLVFEQETGGGYTVRVPALPGCVTYGKNIEEAKAMAEDAVKAYIASLRKHDEPIPSEDTVYITTISIALKGEWKSQKKKAYA